MILGKNFYEFYEKEFKRLLKEIDRRHELKSFDAEEGIKEVISKSIDAIKKDNEENAMSESRIVSEKTGAPVVVKENKEQKTEIKEKDSSENK
tara:strand:- start:18 stop:296 length:279 start_codon:yes stop_codon:yes gene_type:complete